MRVRKTNLKTKIGTLVGQVSLFLICAILLLSANPLVVYAKTFVDSDPATLTIDGTFTDWGTTGSPASGVYLVLDASNSGEQDGAGFNTKSSDINYFWTAISTPSGGDTPASPSNLIQNFYYRLDTHYSDQQDIKQSYYIQLNLGAADPGYADHLLQVWVDESQPTIVTLVLYEYDTPYPEQRAFTTGTTTGKVSNVAAPYPGFTGAVDASATGVVGLYDVTKHGWEVNVPVDWYSSTYGGAVKNDGTGASAVISTVFTGTGTCGAVGTVKDTINDLDTNTVSYSTSTTTGETDFASDEITQIVFTTSAQTITAGEVSSIMTIQTQDALDMLENVTADTTIKLTSTSGTGKFYSDSGGTTEITSVTITSGTNSASFYYKDTISGTPTITADEDPDAGWTAATQQETVLGTLESYKEATHTTVWGTVTDPYSSDTQTVYIYGSNFIASHGYHVAYYDAVGTWKAQSEGVTSGADNTLSSLYLLTTNPSAEAGTWHAVVFDDDLGSPPNTYAECSDAAGYAGEDSFEVAAAAIPEFPAVIAGIAVAGMCGGIYWWMRRRIVGSRQSIVGSRQSNK